MTNYDETLNNEELEMENELYENADSGEGETVTPNDIIENATGLDEYGNPKAGFSIEIGTYNGKTGVMEVKSDYAYYNPSINIVRTGDFTMCDFVFRNRTDSELRTIWAMLNKYGKDFEKALREDSAIIPLFRIQLVPNHYSGRFSILLVTPAYWVLQPETPTSEINTIRMVFSNNSVGFVESEGYNEADIVAGMEREEMQQDYIAQAIERRREEESEYQDDRNAKIEEMRRNRKYD